jgi:hypothetical protein
MKVYYRKSLLCDLETVPELEEFIKTNKFYQFFRKFPEKEHPSIKAKMDITEKVSYKQIRPWLKEVLKYPETIYNKKFLECMGWESNEITEFISNKQKNNSYILSKLKKENPELFYDKTTSRVEYWIKKGYSEEQSKEKVSERQRTFSREICIKKFGEEKGMEIFNKRQNKWIESLTKNPEYFEFQKKKRPYDYIHSEISDLIKRTSFLEKNKEIILDNINCESINDFVDNIIKCIDIKRYSDFHPFVNSKLLQHRFNTTKDILKKIFYEKTSLGLNQQTYGHFVYHNGIRFKSIKEYEIAIFLENKNISYLYEKNYPGSIFKYDFYLPEKNIYIEYYGMLDKKNDNKLNQLQTEYKNKMKEKNAFCQKNNLILIENTNFETLIKMLNEIL